MRTPEEVRQAFDLHTAGWSLSRIAREIGVSRWTIRYWLDGNTPDFSRCLPVEACPPNQCLAATIEHHSYCYLLGLYLGDGAISTSRKGVHRLRIACCDEYPELMNRCEAAMASTLPNKVGRIAQTGCTEVYSDSKHWTCLFPQHGPGRKHERPIFLAPWQQQLVDIDPRPLIAGLIHSDGCRVLNPVAGRLYPRYHFTNASDDIRKIFTDSLNALGIPWTQNSPRNISVARREAVTALDAFVSPKR